MRKTILIFIIACIGLAFFSGCQKPPSSPYVPSDEPGITTRGLDAYDIRLIVAAMAEQMRNEWDHQAQHEGKLPVIAFTGIELERVPFQVNIREIVGWLEREVVNSRRATFTNAIDPQQPGGRSGQQYALIDFQSPDNPYVDQETAVRKGGIQGPDYELFGRIYGYGERRQGNLTEVNYTVEMTLSNIRTGTTAWKGMFPIRKNIRR